MLRNVGPTERYARLAVGVAAGAAAINSTGWRRATLGAVAAAGLGTGPDESPLEQGLRDTELRRHTAMRSALGTAPTTDSGQPRVTPESDVFGHTE